jgi:hypothetical protein
MRFSNIVGVYGLSRRRGDGKREEVIGLLVEELLRHDMLVEVEVQWLGRRKWEMVRKQHPFLEEVGWGSVWQNPRRLRGMRRKSPAH